MSKHYFVFLIFLASCSGENTIRPVRKDIVETVYASGKIIPENEYKVFALGNGIIVDRFVREGDTVSTGAVLYRILSDAPEARVDVAKSAYRLALENISAQSRILADLKLAMESAEAKFRNDSLQYARMKALLDQQAVSKSAFDNAHTAYTISLNQKMSAREKYHATKNELGIAMQNAKSQLTTAQSDLDNYIIKSQSAGSVYQLFKEPGEAVRAGEIVALLGETSKRIIRLAVDQQDIEKIRTGQEVLLKSDVTGRTVLKAVVEKIYPVMNELDQTFRVDARFESGAGTLYVHSSVEANIITSRKKNALLIPRAALVSEDSVMVSNGKRKMVFVQTGIRTIDDVEILGGIDENAVLIVPEQK